MESSATYFVRRLFTLYRTWDVVTAGCAARTKTKNFVTLINVYPERHAVTDIFMASKAVPVDLLIDTLRDRHC